MKKKMMNKNVVVLYLNNPVDFMRSGIVLENPSFKGKGKDKWITGNLWLENKNNWAERKKITVNLGAVDAFIELNSVQELTGKIKVRKR